MRRKHDLHRLPTVDVTGPSSRTALDRPGIVLPHAAEVLSRPGRWWNLDLPQVGITIHARRDHPENVWSAGIPVARVHLQVTVIAVQHDAVIERTAAEAEGRGHLGQDAGRELERRDGGVLGGHVDNLLAPKQGRD